MNNSMSLEEKIKALNKAKEPTKMQQETKEQIKETLTPSDTPRIQVKWYYIILGMLIMVALTSLPMWLIYTYLIQPEISYLPKLSYFATAGIYLIIKLINFNFNFR
jgi:hypothetical protein